MTRRTEATRIRLTPAELADLRSMADERSCSVSAVVRWAIKAALQSEIAAGEKRQNPQNETGTL
jgi:hypothetical protein